MDKEWFNGMIKKKESLDEIIELQKSMKTHRGVNPFGKYSKMLSDF